VVWDRATGNRGAIAHRLAGTPHRRHLRSPEVEVMNGDNSKTGLMIDPFFPAPKVAWISRPRSRRAGAR